MTIDYTKLPRCIMTVDIGKVIGSFETGRFAIGHGAVNSLPLPAIDHKIVPGAGVLPPQGWIVD
jgi:hypothetical protein